MWRKALWLVTAAFACAPLVILFIVLTDIGREYLNAFMNWPGAQLSMHTCVLWNTCAAVILFINGLKRNSLEYCGLGLLISIALMLVWLAVDRSLSGTLGPAGSVLVILYGMVVVGLPIGNIINLMRLPKT